MTKDKIINELIKRLDYDREDSENIYKALMDIYNNDISKIECFLMNEEWYNIYIDVDNYYELSEYLIQERIIFQTDHELQFLSFLKEENNEEKLKKRLVNEGWIISCGVAICK